MADSPNVLIFCVDEMRADHLGCAGNAIVQTPHLDRLAARGTRFSRSYCNNPICMPSRATMFTGLLPRDHGVRINGQALRTDLPTLPGLLAKAGYHTHAAGKLHITPWVPNAEGNAPAPANDERYPESLPDWQAGTITEFPTPYYGFQTVDFVGGHVSYAYGDYTQWLIERGGDPAWLTDELALEPLSGAPLTWKNAIPEELHYNRFIADSTIKLIESHTKPFFAWCSFPDPHMPIAPPKPYCDLYNPDDMPLPVRLEGEHDDLPPYYNDALAGKLKPNGTDTRRIPDAYWQEMIAQTYGMVTHIDAEIGRVLDALERTGQMDNTLIIFLDDHGDMMGDHHLIWKGPYTFRGCINIPTIVVAPGLPAGQVSDALISQVDLLPSILDYCGVPLPGSAWKDIETPFERGAVQPLQLYPGKSWLPLLDGSAGTIHESIVIENDDPTTGFRVRCLVSERYRLTVYPGTPWGELFDLREDSDELFNLWDDSDYSDLRQNLIAQLLSEYSAWTPIFPVPTWNS